MQPVHFRVHAAKINYIQRATGTETETASLSVGILANTESPEILAWTSLG
jgi:hypothetical protein